MAPSAKIAENKKLKSRFLWRIILKIYNFTRDICKNINIIIFTKSTRTKFAFPLLNICYKKVKSQQHQEFPSGLPSKYYPGPMLLNFSDRTRTGVFNMVWPLAGYKAKRSLYK